MPSSELPEKSGNAASYPVTGTFAELLDWHLNYGTRTDGKPDRPGKRWADKEFGAAVLRRSPNEDTCRKSSRNWRTGKSRPNNLGRIEQELFGSETAYDAWRFDLRSAYDGLRQVAPSPPTASIPPRPTHFLGRDGDVDTIVDVLLTATGPACVLVQGPPGIGKTALTRAVGHHPEIVRCFGQTDRWFVELETADTAVAVQDAITRAVGGDPTRGFRAMLERLGRTPGLLILDNLETPWDPKRERIATEAVLTELAAVPGLALLASFRGDDVVRGVEWARIHSIAHLDPPYDTELFCRIANWQRRDDPDLLRLVAALGGVPLAIELIAVRAYNKESLAPLWARWIRKGVELAEHPDFDRGRLTSLPHSIEMSLTSSRLTPDAHRLFRLLGQLPAGLAERDRDSLVGDEGFDAQESLRRIGLTVDRAGRLDLLPPIRDHATRYHGPDGHDAAKWSAHYLRLINQLGEAIGTTAGHGAISRLMPEVANIEAAIRAVLKADRRDEAMAALAGFGQLSITASLPAPVLVDLAEACHSSNDVVGEANCIFYLAGIALARSDHEGARRAFEEALLLYRRADNVVGEANCIFNAGEIALRRSDHEGAERAFEEALLLYRRADSLIGEANCIKGVGDIALVQSNHGGAERAFEEARALYQRADSVFGEANCIFNAGEIAHRWSDHEGARQAFEEALILYRRAGNPIGEANCIRSLGEIALARSDHEGARRAFEEALPLYQRFSEVLGEATCIFNLGGAALARSDHDEARRTFKEALLLYQRFGSVLGEANCIRSLGGIALARSDHEGARRAFKEALPLYQRIGEVLGEATCVLNFGEIAFARSDHEGAERAFKEALLLYQRAGNPIGEANCIRSLGDIALARSDHEGARRAFEEALLLYRRADNVVGEANCIFNAGEIALARSDYEEARRAFEEALPLYRRVGDMLGEAGCIKGVGEIALARSDHEGAERTFEEALPLYRHVGDMLGEAGCIKGVGEIALARSDHEGARRAFEEALPLYRHVGNVLGEATCIKKLEALGNSQS